MYNQRWLDRLRIQRSANHPLPSLEKKAEVQTVEKAQVTVATQAHGLRGELGKCILQCYIALEGHEQQLVVLQNNHGELHEVSRRGWPEGHLKAAQADLLSNMVADALYNCLLVNVGIQGDLEDLV